MLISMLSIIWWTTVIGMSPWGPCICFCPNIDHLNYQLVSLVICKLTPKLLTLVFTFPCSPTIHSVCIYFIRRILVGQEDYNPLRPLINKPTHKNILTNVSIFSHSILICGWNHSKNILFLDGSFPSRMRLSPVQYPI